jgi:hypothetical protein
MAAPDSLRERHHLGHAVVYGGQLHGDLTHLLSVVFLFSWDVEAKYAEGLTRRTSVRAARTTEERII